MATNLRKPQGFCHGLNLKCPPQSQVWMFGSISLESNGTFMWWSLAREIWSLRLCLWKLPGPSSYLILLPALPLPCEQSPLQALSLHLLHHNAEILELWANKFVLSIFIRHPNTAAQRNKYTLAKLSCFKKDVTETKTRNITTYATERFSKGQLKLYANHQIT